MILPLYIHCCIYNTGLYVFVQFQKIQSMYMLNWHHDILHPCLTVGFMVNYMHNSTSDYNKIAMSWYKDFKSDILMILHFLYGVEFAGDFFVIYSGRCFS